MTERRNADCRFSRRTLLRGAAGLGLAAAAGTLLPACSPDGDDGGERRAAGTKPGTKPADEPPPETTSIRLPNIFPVSCTAALALAEPFLREEGFTDIRYPKIPQNAAYDGLVALGAGKIDFNLGYGAVHLLRIEAGAPTVTLGGVHVGCWQVVAAGGIRSMADFKGKTIAIAAPTGADGIYMAMTLANVGVDLRKDVNVVSYVPSEAADLLSSGRVDGLVAFPPIYQELRARGIGTVVVNSMVDRPWSDYFCCMATVRRDWMERHPVATRRALRAVLRAADVAAAEPERAARTMVDGGFTPDYDLAVAALKEIPYHVWREYDPVDSLRFYALRMKEAGLIKSTPDQLIETGTDFRYLEELKTELKEA